MIGFFSVLVLRDKAPAGAERLAREVSGVIIFADRRPTKALIVVRQFWSLTGAWLCLIRGLGTKFNQWLSFIQRRSMCVSVSASDNVW
jgi:hypothetical protein